MFQLDGREVLALFPVAGFVELALQDLRRGDTIDFGNGGRVTVADDPRWFMGYYVFTSTTGGKWSLADDPEARVRLVLHELIRS